MKKITIVSYLEQPLEAVPKAFAGSNTIFILEKDLKENDKPEYAIVDSVQRLTEVRSKFEEQNHQIKFIFVGRNNKVQEFCYLQGAMIVDPFWFSNPLGLALIKRAFEEQPSVHLQEIFNNTFKKYYSYKIQNIFRLGYYADILCKDAIDQKMNFVTIRSFFDHAVLYCSYLKELEMADFPCEFEYAVQDGHLTMMIHLSTSKMTQDYLVESFGEENARNPMSSLLKTCMKNADFFDVMYYPKAKRLTLVGLWVDDSKRNDIAGSTLALNIVGQKSEAKHLLGDYQYDFNHQVDPQELEKLDENGELPKMPGSHQALAEIPEDSVFKNDQDLMKELASFVKDKVAMDNIEKSETGQEIKENELTADDVAKILKDYPDQEVVKKIAGSDQQLLASAVVSGKLADDFVNIAKFKADKKQEEEVIRLTSAAETITDQIVKGRGVFKKPENEVMKVSSSFSPNWEKDIQMVNGAAPTTAEEKVSLASNVTQQLLENIMSNTDYAQVLNNPAALLSDSGEMKISDDLKMAIGESWKNKMAEALGNVDVATVPEEKMQKIMMQQMETVVNTILVAKDPEVAKAAGVQYLPPQENYQQPMQNIEKNLAEKLANTQASPQEQLSIIMETIKAEVKKMPMVQQSQKSEEEVVEEIIEQMDIAPEQKQVIQKKVKKQKVVPVKNLEVEEIEEVEEVEEVEVVSGDAEIEANEYKVKAPSGIKKPKVKPTVQMQTQVEEVEEVESDIQIVSSGPKKVKKNKPLQLQKPKEVEEVEDDQLAIVSGDAEIEANEYNVRPSSGVKAKKVKPEFKQKISGSSEEVEEDVVAVVSGDAEIEANEYTVRPSSGGVKAKKPKQVPKPSKVTGQVEEDDEDEVAVVSGNAEFKGSEYKVKNGQGRKNTDEGYKVREGNGEAKTDEGYKVSQGGGAGGGQSGGDYKPSDNAHLVEKIKQLEEQLQAAKKANYVKPTPIVNTKKEKNSEDKEVVKEPASANIPEPVIVKPVDEKEYNDVMREIEQSTTLSDSQKQKMLEVMRKDREVSEKYRELQEAYHKTKSALDGKIGEESQKMDELERTARHKELLVEQMKTKVANLQKEHETELKRISFDLKKQAQRAASAQLDEMQKKIASLEREKNATKKMMEEFKSKVVQDKSKTQNQEGLISPKVAEAEAQKKRAEVKLQAKEAEVTDLKKTLIAKDRSLHLFNEQKTKLEEELNQWKKEALTKRAETPKVEPTKTPEATHKAPVSSAANPGKSVSSAAFSAEPTTAPKVEKPVEVKAYEEKISALKEEMVKEKAQFNKELLKEREQLEEMKKSYLIEANKVKSLEIKVKEYSDRFEAQQAEAAAKVAAEAAAAQAAKAAEAAAPATAPKDVTGLSTKYRLLEETHKKISKDFNDTKTKLEESKKEIAQLTKKTNETHFKLQEKEKMLEKLQAELKTLKETPPKKAA